MFIHSVRMRATYRCADVRVHVSSFGLRRLRAFALRFAAHVATPWWIANDSIKTGWWVLVQLFNPTHAFNRTHCFTNVKSA
jgi:hypothetical protein